MTDIQIKDTVERVKAAIATKTGKRTNYSSELKTAALAAAKVVGLPQFSQESGLSLCLLSRWKRTLSVEHKNNVIPKKKYRKAVEAAETKNPKVRELIIAPQISPLIRVSKTPERAVIRAGGKLEIEVPLELLTPEWILQVVGGLNSANGVHANHA